MSGPDPDLRFAARRALVFWGIAALLLGMVVAAHATAPILLLTFCGLMFGVWLRGAAAWLSRHAHMAIGPALAVCVGVLLALAVAAIRWIAPHIEQQAGALWTHSLQAFADLRAQLGDSFVGRLLAIDTSQLAAWLKTHALLAETFVIGVFGALGSLAYVMVVALYFAASPQMYRRGALALVPPARRGRAEHVLDELATVLRRWMWARLISMTVVGVASSATLWLLGIPLAATLGLLAGVLLFVPYLGSIIAAVPVLLIAVTVGPWHVLYVGIVYVAIHVVEAYVLTPLLYKRAVATPPLVVLAAELLAGALWGILGFTLATPLVACAMVLVKLLYVEDVLETPA